MMCVEQEDLEHLSTYLCVEKEDMEHMKRKLEVLGISPGAFHVVVANNIWSFGSLAIVSLGVSYKYILVLVLSEEI